MLTEMDIDKIYCEIKENGSCKAYYVVNNVELIGNMRKIADMAANRFSVVEVSITNVINAVFPYHDYEQDKDWYNTVEGVVYTATGDKQVYYFKRDSNEIYDPIIYGCKFEIEDCKDHSKNSYINISQVSKEYVDELMFMGDAATDEKIEDMHLTDWKYLYLDDPVENDGWEYSYVTSNMYCISFESNMLNTQVIPVICVDEPCQFFLDKQQAISYAYQLSN